MVEYHDYDVNSCKHVCQFMDECKSFIEYEDSRKCFIKDKTKSQVSNFQAEAGKNYFEKELSCNIPKVYEFKYEFKNNMKSQLPVFLGLRPVGSIQVNITYCEILCNSIPHCVLVN
ncbi:DgyrCDS14432 [Dimorphilus gyrociliatus]|uniref:DgyrCDS14432 n=1 Tax=Dimorphilus gyrociliatus TaxID=2664684 RepID=A0A7I8WDL1_9ANNE|nr:DgyrCDS14432 [Dimorphilus gyrociliatus]